MMKKIINLIMTRKHEDKRNDGGRRGEEIAANGIDMKKFGQKKNVRNRCSKKENVFDDEHEHDGQNIFYKNFLIYHLS
jgi:hypothetical protein